MLNDEVATALAWVSAQRPGVKELATQELVGLLDHWALNEGKARAFRQLLCTHALQRLNSGPGGVLAVSKYYEEQYGCRENGYPWPAVFHEIGPDVVSISMDEVFMTPIVTFDPSKPSEFGELTRRISAPSHLLTTLSPARRRKILAFSRECQLHWARLSVLDKFSSGTQWVELAKKELRRAVVSALPGFEDYSASRWHSIHAAEKLLKAAAATKKQTIRFGSEKKGWKRDAHSLGKTAEKLRLQAGILVPTQLLDTTPKPSDFRYSTDGALPAASRAQLRTLRLASFLFPQLAKHLGLGYFEEYAKSSLQAHMDANLHALEYPGIYYSKVWQKPETGVYGAKLQTPLVERAWGITREPTPQTSATQDS